MFPRIDVEKEIAELIAIIGDTSGKTEPAKAGKDTAKPAEGTITMEQIGIEDFLKVELRVAKNQKLRAELRKRKNCSS